MKRGFVISAVMCLFAVGCGGSKNGSGGNAQQTAQTPEQAAQKTLEALTQNPGAQGQAKAVEYTELKKLVPEVAGWERSNVKGEQGAMMGISYSRAEGQFQKGDTSVALEITDTAMIQALVMPFTMMAAGEFNQKSDEGYK